MNEKRKYLSLLIALALIVGQVQYAYTSYYCTMKHMSLNVSSLAACSQDYDLASDMCTTCESVLAPYSGHQIVTPNCFQLTTSQKNVIDNFVDSVKPAVHNATLIALLPAQPQFQQVLLQLRLVSPRSDSPPLDLPTLNSNLRI